MKISLLSALPHSLGEVRAAIGSPLKDYVANNLVKFRSLDSAWQEVKQALEVDAESLFTWCTENGISVTRRATLKDLCAAVPTSDIVIVLAHWKGPHVGRVDIFSPIFELSAKIEECFARGILSDPHSGITSIADEDDARDYLVEGLNEGIANWARWLQLCLRTDEAAVISDLYANCMARDEIDRIFGSDVCPGARLELYDGLWRPSDIGTCFPPNWSGIADFVSCTSVYLSDVLKKQTRLALFRADSRLLKPRLVIPGVQRILEAVRSKKHSYIEAAYAIDSEYGGQ